MLTSSDHDASTRRSRSSRRRLLGEIFCIVAHEASNYREVPSFGVTAALPCPALACRRLRPRVDCAPRRRLVDVEGRFGATELLLTSALVAGARRAFFRLISAGLATGAPASPGPSFLKRHLCSPWHAASQRQAFTSKPANLMCHLSLRSPERRVEILGDAAIHDKAESPRVGRSDRRVVSGMRGRSNRGHSRSDHHHRAVADRTFPPHARTSIGRGLAEL